MSITLMILCGNNEIKHYGLPSFTKFTDVISRVYGTGGKSAVTKNVGPTNWIK